MGGPRSKDEQNKKIAECFKKLRAKRRRLFEERRPFACAKCSKTFKFEQHLKSHVGTHASFKCNVCPEEFSKTLDLTVHKRSHSERTCDTMSYQHLNAPTQISVSKFKCTVCKYTARSPSRLDDHLLKHKKEKRFECDDCSKRFTRKYDLNKHVKIHQPESRFQCTLCDFVSHRMEHLERHRRILHKEQGECDMEIEQDEVLCEHCGESFNQSELLASHVEKQHNKQIDRFSCRDCPKLFKRMTNTVKNHQRFHLMQILCEFCGKAFRDTYHLKRHDIVHVAAEI